MTAHDGDLALSASRLDSVIGAIEDGPEVTEVLEIRTFLTPASELVVAARIGVPADKPLRGVEADIARATERVRRVEPDAAHVFLQPEIHPGPPAAELPTSAFIFKSVD